MKIDKVEAIKVEVLLIKVLVVEHITLIKDRDNTKIYTNDGIISEIFAGDRYKSDIIVKVLMKFLDRMIY